MHSLPVLGTINVDTQHKGTIQLGDGWALVDIPTIGKGSIIWREDYPGMQSVDYEAMAARDMAIDASVN